jgi:hypothetical protein
LPIARGAYQKPNRLGAIAFHDSLRAMNGSIACNGIRIMAAPIVQREREQQRSDQDRTDGEEAADAHGRASVLHDCPRFYPACPGRSAID